MDLPKFLIADNSDFPENAYVVHTQKPRFVIDVDSEEIKWFGPEPEADDIVDDLTQQALAFYESELDKYEEEEDDE
ncbi:hypothetical protein D0T53_03585 [Dysgonomonas sp. 216]|uniref:hypothetical protein n=1 Tax=Dysgonomonas sp. 216 TaxID=2302934 RepID=UPI0013D74EDA|nr:hypothetical protein [Dysgonomonas sp. 216]NDW17997.1 hypothetical protein [Dysgonomonas sp. 216]